MSQAIIDWIALILNSIIIIKLFCHIVEFKQKLEDQNTILEI